MKQTEEELREIFEKIANPEMWKLPTVPYETRSREEADKIKEALLYFTGGAEITSQRGLYTVSSKGYYHYIGA